MGCSWGRPGVSVARGEGRRSLRLRLRLRLRFRLRGANALAEKGTREGVAPPP